MNADDDRIRRVAGLLYDATQTYTILTHVGWKNEVRTRFLAGGGRELPAVEYAAFDPEPTVAMVREARRHLRAADPVDEWLERTARIIETSALMLSACGTPDFFKYSSDLYGTPRAALLDRTSTSFALASQFDRLLERFARIDLGAPADATRTAQEVALEIETSVKRMFGDAAPAVQIVEELSANALASPTRIRLRASARFTDKDLRQLVQHEAFIHVATSLNGLAQADLKILGAGHAGTTRTQEGLAVFAEFISGAMDLDRMRRLGDRVLAIQMAIDGADFLEVYRFFLERIGEEEQAFENTRRVFRGGVLTGGAPFTKDIVYLDGLLRVHNFLRALVSAGRADLLRLLFCGKLDIEDIPVLDELSRRGLCRPPIYLPPWAQDLRFLLSYLSYSSFLNGIDLSRIQAHYDALLGATEAADEPGL